MPVNPPAAMASMRTAGNQKRRRKLRRFCVGGAGVRPRASVLRVCFADIESGILLKKAVQSGELPRRKTLEAHAAEATGRATDAANYILTAARSARRGSRVVITEFKPLPALYGAAA